MKLLSILKELSDNDVEFIKHQLGNVMSEFNLRFVITNHAAFDRLIRDKSRQNISRNDVVHTIETFIRKCAAGDNNYSKKLAMYKSQKREIEGLITNLNNNLRIIFAIDFQHPNQAGMCNFKVITAIVADDFRTDARPFTEKFFIR